MRYLLVSWGRKARDWPQLERFFGDGWQDAEALKRDPGVWGRGWWRGFMEDCLTQVPGPPEG